MVPLFILDKKSSIRLGMDSKPLTPVESWQLSKHKKADLELSKCLDGTCTGEVLLKSYVCAWHRDILVQGKLFLTDNWFCFYSNIMGWETKTKINLKDVRFISKQKTALVFPNAILVETVDKKFTFSSFLHRDRAYQVMLAVWENFNLNKPFRGEAFRQHLRRHREEERRHKKWRSRSLEQSSDADSAKVGSCSPDLSSSPSPSPEYLRTNSLPVTCSSHNNSSDWTDASLDMESSSGGGTDVDDGSAASNTSLHSNCCSSIDRGQLSEEEEADTSSTESEVENRSLVASNSATPNKTTPIPIHQLSGEVGGLRRAEEISKFHCERCLIGARGHKHRWRDAWEWACHSMSSHSLICTSSHIINFFILVFIVALLLSLVAMVCRLCQLEPSLHSYMAWQPWCTCLATPSLTPPPG